MCIRDRHLGHVFEVQYPEYLETQSTIERIKYFINN